MRSLSSLLVLLALSISIEAAYSPKLALDMAYMSSIAYESVATINAWSCPKCNKYPLTGVKTFSNSVGDLQGFTGFSSSLNGIVVAFRGSSNIQNWIINLSTNMVAYSKCSGCKVHNGFNTAWGLAKTTVLAQLQTLRAIHRNAPIYITGHSLGGAIATISATDLKEIFGNIHTVLTFGEPRVGNADFSTYFMGVAENYRVVHYGDIVPHIPPSSFGFVHQGFEVWYDKSMKSYKTCAYGETKSGGNSLSATSLNTGDHSMDTYYATLPATPLDYFIKSI